MKFDERKGKTMRPHLTKIRGPLTRLVLGAIAAMGLTVVLASPSARGQAEADQGNAPAPKPAAEATAPKSAVADAQAELRAILAQENLEVLQAQLHVKKAQLQIGESRLAEAKRWKAHYEDLLKSGKVTEERFLSARDDVLMMEAHVAGERAEMKLAEMRVKHAQRRIAYNEPPMTDLGQRLADLEERLTASELKVDLLQHEVGRLRREQPKESKFGPR